MYYYVTGTCRKRNYLRKNVRRVHRSSFTKWKIWLPTINTLRGRMWKKKNNITNRLYSFVWHFISPSSSSSSSFTKKGRIIHNRTIRWHDRVLWRTRVGFIFYYVPVFSRSSENVHDSVINKNRMALNAERVKTSCRPRSSPLSSCATVHKYNNKNNDNNNTCILAARYYNIIMLRTDGGRPRNILRCALLSCTSWAVFRANNTYGKAAPATSDVFWDRKLCPPHRQDRTE